MRVRFDRLILIAALAAVLMFAVPVLTHIGVAAHAQLTGRVPAQVAYTVRPGDTLWAIAVRLDPGGDPRHLMAQLEATNHLNGPLQVGQQIIVPGPAR